jgi:DNA-binding transcriptional LysR family regulator
MVLPSLESLGCFEAAAQLGSFRAAARAVALTPAALGQRIKQLEDQLGARLFERTTRSITLTPAGLALRPRARAALEAAAACGRAVRGEEAPAPMELTLGTRYELGLSFLVPLRGTLEAAHPGLRLHYYFGSGPDLLLRIRGREIDCAVTSSRLNDPALDALRLHLEEYVLVGSRRLLARRPLRRVEDAAGHTLLDIDAQLPLFRYWRDAPDAGDRLRFGSVRYLGTAQAMVELVLDGEGVAVLPLYMVRRHLSAGRLVRALPRVELLTDYFRLVFRADDPRRSVYERLAEALCREELR